MFLLHIPCCFVVVVFCFCFLIWGVSLTHPVLALFLSGEFLLHIPCLLYFYLGSFSYTSHAGFFLFFSSGEFLLSPASFICIRGVSLTHPVLAYLGSFSYTSRAAFFFFIWGVSLTHPMLALFFFGEFLLHIPCWRLLLLFFFFFFFFLLFSFGEFFHLGRNMKRGRTTLKRSKRRKA